MTNPLSGQSNVTAALSEITATLQKEKGWFGREVVTQIEFKGNGQTLAKVACEQKRSGLFSTFLNRNLDGKDYVQVQVGDQAVYVKIANAVKDLGFDLPGRKEPGEEMLRDGLNVGDDLSPAGAIKNPPKESSPNGNPKAWVRIIIKDVKAYFSGEKSLEVPNTSKYDVGQAATNRLEYMKIKASEKPEIDRLLSSLEGASKPKDKVASAFFKINAMKNPVVDLDEGKLVFRNSDNKLEILEVPKSITAEAICSAFFDDKVNIPKEKVEDVMGIIKHLISSEEDKSVWFSAPEYAEGTEEIKKILEKKADSYSFEYVIDEKPVLETKEKTTSVMRSFLGERVQYVWNKMWGREVESERDSKASLSRILAIQSVLGKNLGLEPNEEVANQLNNGEGVFVSDGTYLKLEGGKLVGKNVEKWINGPGNTALLDGFFVDNEPGRQECKESFRDFGMAELCPGVLVFKGEGREEVLKVPENITAKDVQKIFFNNEKKPSQEKIDEAYQKLEGLTQGKACFISEGTHVKLEEGKLVTRSVKEWIQAEDRTFVLGKFLKPPMDKTQFGKILREQGVVDLAPGMIVVKNKDDKLEVINVAKTVTAADWKKAQIALLEVPLKKTLEPPTESPTGIAMSHSDLDLSRVVEIKNNQKQPLTFHIAQPEPGVLVFNNGQGQSDRLEVPKSITAEDVKEIFFNNEKRPSQKKIDEAKEMLGHLKEPDDFAEFPNGRAVYLNKDGKLQMESYLDALVNGTIPAPSSLEKKPVEIPVALKQEVSISDEVKVPKAKKRIQEASAEEWGDVQADPSKLNVDSKVSGNFLYVNTKEAKINRIAEEKKALENAINLAPSSPKEESTKIPVAIKQEVSISDEVKVPKKKKGIQEASAEEWGDVIEADPSKLNVDSKISGDFSYINTKEARINRIAEEKKALENAMNLAVSSPEEVLEFGQEMVEDLLSLRGSSNSSPWNDVVSFLDIENSETVLESGEKLLTSAWDAITSASSQVGELVEPYKEDFKHIISGQAMSETVKYFQESVSQTISKFTVSKEDTVKDVIKNPKNAPSLRELTEDVMPVLRVVVGLCILGKLLSLDLGGDEKSLIRKEVAANIELLTKKEEELKKSRDGLEVQKAKLTNELTQGRTDLEIEKARVNRTKAAMNKYEGNINRLQGEIRKLDNQLESVETDLKLIKAEKQAFWKQQ